jgi:L-threonylcarbamoyladenylate synthase
LSNAPPPLKVDPRNPGQQAIAVAARTLREGGVVVFPTHGLYGLGADATAPAAVEKIYRIKQRPLHKPLLILIARRGDLKEFVRRVPPVALPLMERFWPGRLTLVFEAGERLPRGLCGGTDRIGIRLTGHPVAAALVRAAGCPLTGTSANLSSHRGCARIDHLQAAIARQADLILDAGALAGGRGSTVVDVTCDPPRILREGAVSASRIASFCN